MAGFPRSLRASVTAGTVMHRAHLPLSVWLWAAFLMATLFCKGMLRTVAAAFASAADGSALVCVRTCTSGKSLAGLVLDADADGADGRAPVFSAAASLEVAAMWIVRVRARPRHGSTAQPSRSA